MHKAATVQPNGFGSRARLGVKRVECSFSFIWAVASHTFIGFDLGGCWERSRSAVSHGAALIKGSRAERRLRLRVAVDPTARARWSEGINLRVN